MAGVIGRIVFEGMRVIGDGFSIAIASTSDNHHDVDAAIVSAGVGTLLTLGVATFSSGGSALILTGIGVVVGYFAG